MTELAFSTSDLTVSVATIDRPEFFAASLESLISTTPTDVSIQVILNEATEESRRIAERLLSTWEGPSKIVSIEHRLSITDSHQRALEECSTRLINFMGDDDLCLAPRFERVIDAFNSIDGLQIVGSWVMRAGGDPKNPSLVGRSDIGPPTVEEWQRHRDLGVSVQVNFPSAVFLTEALRDINGFESRFGGAFDKAVIGKLAQRGPVVALQERDFAFRIHNSSDSATNFFDQARRAQYIDHCLAAIDRGAEEPNFEDFVRDQKRRPLATRLRERQNVRSRYFFRTAGAAWANRQRAMAVRAALRSALADPVTFVRKILEQRGRREGFELG